MRQVKILNVMRNRGISPVNYIKNNKIYHEMLDLKNVTTNKELWKTVKPFLSDKVTTFPATSLVGRK